MNKFDCQICKKKHELVTLIEFPQPAIISQITSGKRAGTIDVMGKNSFIVDKKVIFILCELIIDIIDYEDEIELLVWVEVTREEYLSKMENLKDIDEVKLVGKLNHSIPFYENSDKIIVEIYIDLNDINYKTPKISNIGIDHQIKYDFNKGINLNEFITKLSNSYHAID